MTIVVHSIHFPVSARNFIQPMVANLNDHHLESELWLENNPKSPSALQNIYVPHRIVMSDLSANPYKLFYRVLAFRAQLRSVRPQLLHAHQTRASFVPLLAAKLERVPIRIYHNHGLPYLGYRGTLRLFLRTLELVNISLATHVVFVSHSNLAVARQDRLVKTSVGRVLGPGTAAGIDLQEYVLSRFTEEAKIEARRKLGLNEKAFVLLFIGRAVKRKGFHLLLRAWEKSGLGSANNILLFAGCSPSECQSALGREVHGTLGLGYVSNLGAHYSACDSVVLPSFHEGFPYSLLEGAAACRALIGSDIPGIRCAIEHERTGLLVPCGDETALAQSIRALACNPIKSRDYGLAGRNRIERYFNRSAVLKAMLEYYQTLGLSLAS